jgi:hypothetical protein
VLSRLGRFKRAVGKRLSRTRFLARMLGVDVATESPAPGMIMIQVDGLSREQFEAAIARNRLPFLKRMMRNGHFTTAAFYSGLPSTTPAVQAEVMYGIRCAVPAFQFVDRSTGRVFRMSEQQCAKEVAAELSERSEPLLKDGASYSNIFSGGSSDAFGCSETADVNMVLQIINPVKILVVCLTYSLTLLRILGLAVVEVGIAVYDMAQGILQRRDWQSELKFVPARAFICIVIREWLRVLVKLAIERGSPVIVCGDFNAGPKSSIIRQLSTNLSCVQSEAIDHRPKVTFASVMPIRQLDHILASRHFRIGAVTIPRTPTAVVASDHLPICAAIQFRPVPVAPDRHAVPPPAMDARCRTLFLMPKRSGGIPPGDVRVFSQQASKHRRSAVVFPPAIQPSGDGLPP